MKSKKWVRYVIVLGVLALAGIFFFNSDFSGDSPFLSITNQCNLAGSGTTQNVFSCPSDCDIILSSECNQATSEPTVIFRTNANSKEDYNTRTLPTRWIAIRGLISGSNFIKTDSLQLYCVTSSAGASNSRNQINIQTVHNTRLFAYNGNLFVETGSTGSTLREYSLCNDLVDESLFNEATQSSLSIKYANKEIVSGNSDAYSCEVPYFVNDVEKGKVSYSSDSPGKAMSKLFTIGRNDVVRFSGDITYAIIDQNNACVQSTCNSLNTGYYGCEVQNSCGVRGDFVECGTGTVCSETSQGAVCSSPIDVISSEFQDVDGNVRSGYSLEEEIYFSHQVNSESTNKANVITEFRDLNGNLLDTSIEQVNFPNPTSSVVHFDNPGRTGTYKVILRVEYDNGKKIVPKEFEIRVADQITLEIIGSSEGSVKTIYTNAPGIVELRTFDESGKSTSAETKVISVKLKEGNKETILTPFDTNFKSGEYQYFYNIPSIQFDSLLLVEAEASKLGFTVKKTEDFIVKPANILIELPNVKNLVDLSPGIIKTVEIQTKNPQQELMDVDSIKVTATLPSGNKEPVNNIEKVGIGKYKFDYQFDLPSGIAQGAYFFEVETNKQGFISQPKTSQAISVAPDGGSGLECTNNNQCGVSQICSNNQCVADTGGGNVLFYVFVSILSVGGIFMVFIIYRLIKSKKSQVSSSVTGFGGL